ncbi:pseudouridine synthase [Desulfomarina profundi]|uniref:Pseudouridine synthase n=2 Tax=Desulfomarina profundi TaxID=2772557 RepID=A0A8D5JFX8_9BACT|nr:pseudouridine synthase [Desulfomarina profundi]
MAMNPLRLQKYLAHCGVASRRKCEEFIQAGRVRVDGKIVDQPGVKITPGRHNITFDGQPVSQKNKHEYYLLNKPAGYVTTLSDPQGRPVVRSLLKNIHTRLFPVGRLDIDTEGALILTNDGQFAQKVQHPSFETNKTYEAVIRGHIKQSTIRLLEKGIMLEKKMTAPAKIRFLSQKGKNSAIQITIHEGRKRQVRKMFGAVGHPVIHLKRIAYGRLQLRNLPPGQYRKLDGEDLKKVFL